MIPSTVPQVGKKVKFGDDNKSYTVKNVVEDITWENGRPEGTGEGWVCLVDQYNNEYTLPFSRFVPQSHS